MERGERMMCGSGKRRKVSGAGLAGAGSWAGARWTAKRAARMSLEIRKAWWVSMGGLWGRVG
jgi:hypothetical protein